MYLHIGGSAVVRKADVVAVCDLDNASQSRITRDFLRTAEAAGCVINAAEDLPKSCVICSGPDGAQRVYLSQLMSSTLLKRLDAPLGENLIDN